MSTLEKIREGRGRCFFERSSWLVDQTIRLNELGQFKQSKRVEKEHLVK